MTFFLGKDDEFEDEPEDELASAGMHVVDNDEDDEDEDDKPAAKLEEELDDDLLGAEDVEEEKEKDPDAAPDGLEELEELEKELINEPLTFGGDDEE